MNRGAVLWVRADVRRRWPGLLVLAVLAGFSAAVVMIAVVGARRTESALPRALDATQVADVSLQFNDPAVEAAVLGAPQVVEGDSPTLYVGGVSGVDAFDLNVIVASDGGYGTKFEQLVVNRGRSADPAAAHEVVVPPATAAAIGVGVGDAFVLETLSPDQLRGFVTGEPPADDAPAGPSIELAVVGIGGTVPELVDAAPGVVYATTEFGRMYADQAGHFGGPSGLGGLARVRLQQGQDDFDGFVASVLAAPGADRWGDEIIFEPLSNFTERASGTLGTLSTGALVFAVVAGLAAVVAVGLSVARHVQRSGFDQQTLAALGLTRRERAVAACLAVAPCAVGALIAAVLATILGSTLTPFGAARGFETEPGIIIDWHVLVAGALTLVVSVAAAAIIAAWSSVTSVGAPTRLRPGTAEVLASRTGNHTRLAAGIRLAFEQGRGTGRLINRSALVAGVLAVAGLAGGLAYASNLEELIERPARWGWVWDVRVEFEPDRMEDAIEAISGMGEVGDLTVITDRPLLVEGRSTTGQSMDVRKGTAPVVLHAGRIPASPDEIAVGPALARALDVDVGDTVTLEGANGPRPLTVVGRVTLYPADDTALGTDALLETRGLEQVAASDGTAVLAVSRSPNTSRDDLLAALEPLEGDIITLSGYSHPRAPSEVINASSLRPVPWALAGFLVVLGMAAVTHAVHSTLRRRRRDLAVLRALGFGPTDERTAIRWQTACITVVALVFGLPLGLIGGRLVFETLVEDAGLERTFGTSAFVVAGAVIASICALQLLAVALGARAGRVRPAAILRAE